MAQDVGRFQGLGCKVLPRLSWKDSYFLGGFWTQVRDFRGGAQESAQDVFEPAEPRQGRNHFGDEGEGLEYRSYPRRIRILGFSGARLWL